MISQTHIRSVLLSVGFAETSSLGWAGDKRLDPPPAWGAGRASVYIDEGVLRATGVKTLIPRLNGYAPATGDGRNCKEWKGRDLENLLAALSKTAGSTRT